MKIRLMCTINAHWPDSHHSGLNPRGRYNNNNNNNNNMFLRTVSSGSLPSDTNNNNKSELSRIP